MRILYDHQVTSLQDAGGISVYFYQVAGHIVREEGIDVTLLLGRNNSVVPFTSLTRDNCHVRSSATRLKRGFTRYAVNEVSTSARLAVAGKFDIYHPTLYRCMPFARTRATVVTHHDCILEMFPELFRDVAARRHVKRRQFARADAIVCVSENSRQDLVRFYEIAPEKLRVIHLGVTALAAGTLPGENRSFGPYLLYVGGRKLVKNFQGLIRAFGASRLRNEFRIVCAGGGDFTKEESQLIASEGLQGRVTLLPRVPDDQMGALYREAHVFVYPSLYEGFGLPPLEAMICGTVPVVSQVSSIPEVCGEGAIYFDPQSVESMVDSLERACYDATLREGIRQKGATVVTRYSWERCAEQTLRLYRDLESK